MEYTLLRLGVLYIVKNAVQTITVSFIDIEIVLVNISSLSQLKYSF